ncbi:MAG: metallophosphoesterase [Candidatus Micrarchaeota archaeon]
MPPLRILAFADTHSDEEAFDGPRQLATKDDFDLVLAVGDLTTRGPVSYAQELLDLFEEKICFVHGNMDSGAVLDMMRERAGYIHGRKKKIGEWNLVGLGGSNPTPFSTPSEMSEKQIETILRNVEVDRFSIVASHPPPKGLFDQVGDMNVGSLAVREMIERAHPLLVVCAHIHEQEGQAVHGDTLVVKVGAAEARRAARIVIGDDIAVEFFTF